MSARLTSGRLTLLLLPVVAGWMWACAAQPAPQLDREAAAKGETVFVRYCTSCHGADAMGDGELAAELETPPPDLTALSAKYAGEFPFQVVQHSIAKGTPGHDTPDMPSWTEVFAKTEGTDANSPEQAILFVTHYLWSIQKSRAALTG